MFEEVEISRKKQKDGLTLFGRYFENACQHMALSWEQLAKRAELHQTTISTITREGAHVPTRSTLAKIVSVFRHYDYWNERRERILFNLAEWADGEQVEQAKIDAEADLASE